MTANITDPGRVEAQRRRKDGRGRSRDRGALAGQLVRDWDPEKRARIREQLRADAADGGLSQGEAELLALIEVGSD